MKSEDVCVSLLLLKQSGIAPGFCLLGLPMRCQVGVRERYDGYYSFDATKNGSYMFAAKFSDGTYTERPLENIYTIITE